MIDITAAIGEGVETAKLGESNHREISGLISSVASQLHAYTGEKAELIIADAPKRNTSLLSGQAKIEALRYPESIYIEDQEKRYPIAKFGRSPLGYPCWFSFNGQELVAQDTEALGLAFQDLFRTHKVGLIIHSILNSGRTNDEEDGLS